MTQEDKNKMLEYAEELVRLSKDSVDRCKRYPGLFGEDQLKHAQEELEIANRLLEGIKNNNKQ